MKKFKSTKVFEKLIECEVPIEKILDKIVKCEVIVEKIVETINEVPIIEKIVEMPVGNKVKEIVERAVPVESCSVHY